MIPVNKGKATPANNNNNNNKIKLKNDGIELAQSLAINGKLEEAKEIIAVEAGVDQDIEDKVETIIQKFRARISQQKECTYPELEELRQLFENNNLNHLNSIIDEIDTTLDEKCKPMC